MRRRLAFFILLLTVLGAAGFWFYHRVTERSRTIEAIIAAGGKHQSPPIPSFIEVLFETIARNRRNADEVLLDGPKFDDAWLAAHRDLRSIDIRELMIRDTRLSREAVLRLLERRELQSFTVPCIPLNDADAELIGEQPKLTHVNFMQSGLTDNGLAALKPQRLSALNVAGTRITSAALQKELAASQIQYLWIDGLQFTPELAAQLSQMKTLNMLALMGPDVTDAHVKLIESMQNLKYVRFDQTRISAEAAEALRIARMASLSVDLAPPGEVFFKWRVE